MATIELAYEDTEIRFVRGDVRPILTGSIFESEADDAEAVTLTDGEDEFVCQVYRDGDRDDVLADADMSIDGDTFTGRIDDSARALRGALRWDLTWTVGATSAETVPYEEGDVVTFAGGPFTALARPQRQESA